MKQCCWPSGEHKMRNGFCTRCGECAEQPTPRRIRVPKGPTQNTWYVEGYQAAMIDITNALNEGGESAARRWLANNTMQTR